MSDNMHEIADRIREMREICDYTPAQLAAELGIPVALYESYEQTGGNIPISTLHHLANVFGVDMSVLMTGYTSRIDTYHLVPDGKGLKVDRYPGYFFQSLGYKFANKIMEPMIVTLEPSETLPDLVEHRGQELNYVLEGAVEVLYDDKRLRLEVGDSIYFDPTHPHGQRALDGKPAKFLTVIAE